MNITSYYYLDDDDNEIYDYQCLDCWKVCYEDEMTSCDSDKNEIIHDCNVDSFYCVCEWCDAEREANDYNSQQFDYELEKAGGLDAVQEEERRRYYVAKYGEY